MSKSNALAIKIENVRGARSVISWFTWRRMALGAAIFGLFAVVESLAQSLGIIASFPNVEERAKFIHTLASNAALGLFYGDSHTDIVSPGGYMVYRILPALALIGAIWALLFATKMLRGQEENGRWELLLAGQTSAKKATAKTLAGIGAGLVVSYIFVAVFLIVGGRSDKLNFGAGDCLLYSLAVIAGPAIAVGIGGITSQLAATRRRAVLYGLVLIISLFIVRSVGNVVDSLAWVKNLTPFGWIDKLHVFNNLTAIWLVPMALFTLICVAATIWLSGKRDMAESFIADKDSAKPKFGLLGSQLGFAFRSSRSVLSGWLFASLAFAAVIAAIDKTVAKSISSVNPVGKSITHLTGNPNSGIEIAYLSAAAFFTVIVLMILVTNGLSAAREEESSGRLDNFVSANVNRGYWLSMRLLLLLFSAFVINTLSGVVVWVLAEVQSIHVSFTTVVFGGLNILGPVIFLLGVGVLFYGVKPRLAVIAMYTLIAWSFTIDILAAAIKNLNKYIADTSLLHHISLVPAANANWKTFGILAALGLTMTSLGLLAFQNRDLEAE